MDVYRECVSVEVEDGPASDGGIELEGSSFGVGGGGIAME